jgi:hypothetical protein
MVVVEKALTGQVCSSLLPSPCASTSGRF